MSKYVKYVPLGLFFVFICWMIFLADMNQENTLMAAVRKLPSGDKMAHFFLFGLLGLLLNFSLNFKMVLIARQYHLLGSVIVLFFAICEELSQLGFAHRTFDWVDLVFDFLGVSVLSSNRFQNQLRSLTRRKK